MHALANVVSVDVEGGPPPDRAVPAINALLPRDLAVSRAEPAADDFHARYDARSRSYRYRVWRRRERSALEARRSLWYPRPLDLEALNENAASLLGEHDFRAFTPAETQHTVVRANDRERAVVELDENVVAFEITADSFLRHMVRTLVGSMLAGPRPGPAPHRQPRGAKRAQPPRRTASTSRDVTY